MRRPDMGHGNGLRTGEVAERAGVNVQTLRYYERRGLIAEPARSIGGHRTYPPDTVALIGVIKAAQRLGFTPPQGTRPPETPPPPAPRWPGAWPRWRAPPVAHCRSSSPPDSSPAPERPSWRRPFSPSRPGWSPPPWACGGYTAAAAPAAPQPPAAPTETATANPAWVPDGKCGWQSGGARPILVHWARPA